MSAFHVLHGGTERESLAVGDRAYWLDLSSDPGCSVGWVLEDLGGGGQAMLTVSEVLNELPDDPDARSWVIRSTRRGLVTLRARWHEIDRELGRLAIEFVSLNPQAPLSWALVDRRRMLVRRQAVIENLEEELEAGLLVDAYFGATETAARSAEAER